MEDKFLKKFIFKNTFDQFGCQVTIFIQKWQFRNANLLKGVKISVFDPKKGRKYF